MQNPQPIQFLLHKLATNEKDLEKFNKFNSNFSLFLDFQKKDDDQYSNLHKYYVPNKGSFWMKVPKPMMMCRLEQSYAENKDSDYGTVSMFFPDDYNYFFNLCKEELAKYHETTITPKQYEDFGGFRKIPDYLLELFIRTCLSRVNGEAVLRVFDKKVFDFDFVGQARWDSNAKQIKEILNDNNLYQRELKLKELRLLAYYFRQPIYFVNNGRYKNPNDNYEYTNHNISAWMVTNNYYLNPFHFGDVSKFGDLGKLSDLDKDNLFFLFPEKQNKHLLQKLDLFFLLNQAFDFPLRNGKPLSEAIQALHNKMIELVPKYVEFINNNK